MRYLVDSNVLLRWIDIGSPMRSQVKQAFRVLYRAGDTLCITPQNVMEFWNVCTRPTTARGGFGLAVVQARQKVLRLERLVTYLPDMPTTHTEWKQLVSAHSVLGVQVYDARLVAAMRVHGVTHILTFNTSDFKRYPGITAVNPADVTP